MKPRIVEPVSAAAAVMFPLREAASALLHHGSRRRARTKASFIEAAPPNRPLVNYGRLEISSSARLPIGGQIKLIPLKANFPENLGRFNLIYLVSSALPEHAEEIVAAARKKGIKLVWNQNGIAYPGCYGDYYAWFNLRMAELRSQADYIFNQSEFSRLSAERYLGPSAAPSEICLNPVDTGMFTPAESRPAMDAWQILASGTSHALYRTESAVDTLRELISRGRRAHLTIAGEFRWKGAESDVRRILNGLRDHVTILPPFQQSEAPAIYRRAHILLHTKFNDPCPTVPIEAMSCGVPVVGTHSGGMPELVPDTAGILVPVRQSWTEDIAGDPSPLANAVERIMENHTAMSQAAREHAIRTLDVNRWLARHAAVFQQLLTP